MIDYIVFLGAMAITFAIVPIIIFSMILTVMLVSLVMEFVQDKFFL
jgi:hypothetical protein